MYADERPALIVQPVRASLLLCLAVPAAIDQMARPAGVASLRVARDEALLVGPPDGEQRLAASAGAALATLDRDSLTAPVSGAWALWSLRPPPAAAAALSRMTAVPMPPAGAHPHFVQGVVAGVAARILVRSDRICVLVASSVAHHFRDRVMAACADMNPAVGPSWDFDATPWSLTPRSSS